MSVPGSPTPTSTPSEDNQFFAGAVVAAVILATTAAYYTFASQDKEDGFPKLQGIQLYHAWNFFRQRYDFFWSNLEKNLGEGFSFNVLHHNIVALTGKDARQIFFSNPHLNFNQGYRILVGTAPRVSEADMAVENEGGDMIFFKKRFNKVLSKARIQDVLPTLLQDVIEKTDTWGNDGKTGKIDPYTEIYDLVFTTTARMATCHDLMKNEADLKKVGELLTTIHTSATPASLVLPWFPSRARRARKQATTELYDILHTYVENRRHTELRTSDAIDLLITDGETTQDIVGFIIKTLFAGISNTSSSLYWVFIDLAIHPEWREKCKNEIQDLFSRYLGDSSASLHEKLGAIPVSAWEDELPILEACTRESQRIAISGVALRRNLREEVKIGGRVVKQGDFLAYSFGDVHLNSEYYSEPYKYDPGRWLRPDPVPDAAYTFLSWGAGRHPCIGMKVAKLEMKFISAMFLVGYEFDLVDADGKFPKSLPVPNRNDIIGIRPLGATYYFNFKKVVQ